VLENFYASKLYLAQKLVKESGLSVSVDGELCLSIIKWFMVIKVESGVMAMVGEAEVGETAQITVHVKYGDVEQTFSGSVNDVWVSVNKFFSETVPAFEDASITMLDLSTR
jgi:hypothetical protein